jgi:hypothetical protein
MTLDEMELLGSDLDENIKHLLACSFDVSTFARQILLDFSAMEDAVLCLRQGPLHGRGGPRGAVAIAHGATDGGQRFSPRRSAGARRAARPRRHRPAAALAVPGAPALPAAAAAPQLSEMDELLQSLKCELRDGSFASRSSCVLPLPAAVPADLHLALHRCRASATPRSVQATAPRSAWTMSWDTCVRATTPLLLPSRALGAINTDPWHRWPAHASKQYIKKTVGKTCQSKMAWPRRRIMWWSSVRAP